MYYPSVLRTLLRTAGVATALALAGCGGGGGGDTLAGIGGNAATQGRPQATTPPAAPPAPPPPPAAPLPTAPQSSLAQLGRQIFNDTNLSEPRGTACVACHQPDRGFAGNHGSRIGVALGSQAGALGLRNAMTNSYVGLIPGFSFETVDGKTEALGGHFWDGRSDTLAQQALGPLLNPLEMNNPSRRTVVDKVAASRYAPAFRQQFGTAIFDDTELAFTQIGVAIEAFEREALQPFSSKYDAVVRGTATLTPQEARGMALFMDPTRANCAGCHLMKPTSGKPEDSPFSEFTFYATGVPRNTAIPRNADPSFFDLGLCGPERTAPTLPATVAVNVSIENFCGQFRMPTLRNVAERQSLMHNGFFNNLSDVVRFYSTRLSNPQRWYGPAGVPNDLPAQYLRNVESTKAPFNRAANAGPVLSEAEVNDIVVFLHTLSDGFTNP
jgi:cytochrome c peroxidase